MGTKEAVVLIIVAVVGSSGIPVWFLSRLDRKNTSQHGESREVLDSIRADMTEVRSDVSEVKGRLIDHLSYHLETERDGLAGRTDGIKPGAEVRSEGDVGKPATKSRKRASRTD